MEKEMDYLYVLRALDEIPFGVGKKLLVAFLQGDEDNDSISRNHLDNKPSFGSLAYSEDELMSMIDNLLMNKLIQLNSINQNKFWKVLELSPTGREELRNPSLYKKKLSYGFNERKTVITQDDKKLFFAFHEFLSGYNDEQKKAIVSNKEKILCIAGAGSGKTSVLVKRIEFLVKYRSVDPKKILAITFTRKAKQEMKKRLEHLGLELQIETFNSFCEKILRNHNSMIYGKPVRVTTYRDKIVMIKEALESLNLKIDDAINIYFSLTQRRSKSDEQLANIFMNDCFFIRDYFKFKHRKIEEEAFIVAEHEESAKLIFKVCSFIEESMSQKGLRDFADQLLDCIEFFKEHKDLIPDFEHVLIDEYQDVNSTQIKLVDLLLPKNLFSVGDPRQSIYGWRGSDIKYILNFEDKYKDAEISTLTKNYRSTKHIVELINKSIKNMNISDLESSFDGNKDIKLIDFDSEAAEFEFIVQSVLNASLPRDEIFVLARTNRQLNELSQLFKLRGIRHIVRSDENKKPEIEEGEVTLATIHGIKGLEANMVFVVGCNIINFPCKGSEHPVIEMVKVDEYDKEEEERRLFYVAMSRAKESLFLSYSGKVTPFISDEMLKLIEGEKEKVKVDNSNDVMINLSNWRTAMSKKHEVPAYVIMHDRTLIELAQNMPMTLEELESIHGMGPAKILKYGEEILKVMHG